MPTAPPSKKGGSSDFFTKKVGPLPMWGWIAVAVVGVILYRRISGGSSSSGSTSGTTAAEQAALLQAQAAADAETLTTSGGTYTGPAGGAPSSVTNPTTTTTAPTTTTTTATSPGPSSSGSSSPGAGPATYMALTGGTAAVQGDLNNGQTLYQSGAEADAWDLANGTPPGQTLADPNGYYSLSPAAALGLAQSGKPVYVQMPGS